MAILVVPVMILNFLGGIVGGIWLAYLGYWGIIIAGLILVFTGTFVVSIMLSPAILVMRPILAIRWVADTPMVIVPLSVLSVIYTYSVMGIWAIGIFLAFSEQVQPLAQIPVLLWAYSTATAVWSYMAQCEAEQGNEYSVFSSFFNQLGCIALIIYSLNNFSSLNPYEMAIWFGAPMAISLVAQVSLMIATMNSQRA